MTGKAWIAGVGAVTPWGLGAPLFWEKVFAGQSAIAPLTRFTSPDPERPWVGAEFSPAFVESHGRGPLAPALLAAREAANQVSAGGEKREALVLQTNHFQAPGWSEDSNNYKQQQEGTTLSRHDRLEALLDRLSGHLTPALAASILRDRSGPQGQPRALGHRGTICPLIATHAVVADVGRGILWVSQGPHQLGSFEAFSIDTFGASAPAESIPADPLLQSPAWQSWVQVSQKLPVVRKNPTSHLETLRKLNRLLPNHPELLRLLGKALEANGFKKEALQAYQGAQQAPPAFAQFQRSNLKAIQRLAR